MCEHSFLNVIVYNDYESFIRSHQEIIVVVVENIEIYFIYYSQLRIWLFHERDAGHLNG